MQGLLHRTVYAIIVNSSGEWLLQRRHDDKAIAGGCWVRRSLTFSLFRPGRQTHFQHQSARPVTARPACSTPPVCYSANSSRGGAPAPRPDQDLSAAEHLNPGEEFPAAALRGLREELGVDPSGVQGLEQARALRM